MPKEFLIPHFLEGSAEKYPEKVAFIHNNVRTPYRQINEMSNRLAGFLLKLGAKKEDRVVIICENRLEYVAGYYGTLKAGCIVCPLNPGLRPDGLRLILLELEPFILIASARFQKVLEIIDLKKAGIKRLVLISSKNNWDDSDIAAFNWEEINSLTDKNGNACIPQDENAAASIIYTSGTTAKPKGVILSHRNIVSNTISICEYLDLKEKDIHMIVLPFFYVMGKSLLNTHFAAGGTVIINNKFAFTATVITQMAEERVTGFSGVPSTFSHLLYRSPLLKFREKLNALRYCAQAGGHMARKTKLELKKALPAHTDIFIMYGATEASARISYLEPGKYIEKMGSIGRPIKGVTLKILDIDGKELDTGKVGELVAQGPSIMQGYWKDEEGTNAVLDQHGYHTGDFAYQDENGYYYLTGRKDDMLKVGGHRINVQEIENALMETELLIEAVVVGIPDELLEKKLVVLAVPRDDTCPKSLILKKCSKLLPRHKLPSKIVFIKSLPKLVHGKIDRIRSTEIICAQERKSDAQ